jgi:hypothetical protein
MLNLSLLSLIPSASKAGDQHSLYPKSRASRDGGNESSCHCFREEGDNIHKATQSSKNFSEWSFHIS